MQEKFTQGIKQMHQAIVSAESADQEAVVAELESDFGGGVVAAETYEIQTRKAKLMQELKSALAALDEMGIVGVEGKMRRVAYDAATDGLYYYGKDGKRTTMRRGQLQVAGMWGESFFLDQTIPREVQKRYLVQRARYQLSDLYDHQIALFEAHQDYNQNTGLDVAYQAVADHHKEGSEIPTGLLAEQMVESFLTKLTHDYDLPYQLKSVTAYDDVEYKIDFIIEPMITKAEGAGMLGVGVADPEARPDIAIQFTTAQNEVTVEHKKRQISQAKSRIAREDTMRIKDLVLIVLPIAHVADVYAAWQNTKANRRIPGGPDELWGDDVKEIVFRGVLEKVFTQEEVSQYWTTVLQGE